MSGTLRRGRNSSPRIILPEVEVNGERFGVVGLGGVIVSAPHRVASAWDAVLEAALARARRIGPAFAILFCHEDLAGLCRKLGFAAIDDEVIVTQPDGPPLEHVLGRWSHRMGSRSVR